jgi:hypothetical protein
MFLHRSYFDASYNGQPSGGSYAVAGWLATGERWNSFASQWQAVLNEFSVPYMHMKEFAHFRGPYQNGWKNEEEKRREFIRKLNTVIAHHQTASFVCLIDRDKFEKANQEFELREYFGNEFALCGLSCVQQIYKWLKEQNKLPSADSIFEDGDERGKLTDLLKMRGYPEPAYRPKFDKTTPAGIIPGMLPLQAADMLAYEARLNFDKYGDAEAAMKQYRKSFLALADSSDGQGEWIEWKEEDIRENCQQLGLKKRAK